MKGQEKERCLHLMIDILKILKSTTQHEEVFYRTIDLITRVLPCQSVAVVLIDPVSEYLKIDCTYGISHTFQKHFERKISTGAVGELIWNNKPIVIRDSQTDPVLAQEVQLEQPFGSCVCVPVGADHRSLGYLFVASDLTHAFDVDDEAFLQACADVMGVAYQKCWLAEENLRIDRIDHETGLEKYQAFQERLRAALDRGVQFKESFAVVLCDVDNFKHISLTYGYNTSRELLMGLGNLLKQNIRSVDATGRFGFDEFAVLRENTDSEAAMQFAENIRKAVEITPFTSHGIQSTISVGLAVFPQNGASMDDLMVTAKKALFEAQKSGRNKVVVLPGVWYQRQDPVVSEGR
ncbi:MAG TPA: sensor domain-containing diguanylate cyclase [Bacteroidota bacterium]|nr:sensor domain-containing diguanylate cyclase [Bacteroidota bacterium]